jgi:hypothetical protein
VFVIVDALRADRVGAVGDTTDLTPHIDDIAATEPPSSTLSPAPATPTLR